MERALSLLIGSGEQANALLREILDDPDVSADEIALAHAVRGIYELREGDEASGLAALADAAAAATLCRDRRRTDDLVEHGRALWHRHHERLAEAESILRSLHLRAEERPAADAYLSAAALGIVVSMRGQSDEALDLFFQATSMARRSGSDGLLVNALNNLGSFHADLYNLDDALPLLEESLQGARRLGARRQVIYAAGNLVQCLCLMGEATRALQVARDELIPLLHPDDLPALHRDEEIAQALLDNGLVDEAADVLGGEVSVDPMSNELATIRVWLSARILLARGDARAALDVCMARHEQIASSDEGSTTAADRLNLLRIAARAANEVGESELAYRLLNEAFLDHERLLGRAARTRHLSLQINQRLRDAEQERDLARQLSARLAGLNQRLELQAEENSRLQERLRVQALEDPLTGLHNRRYLMNEAPLLLERNRAAGRPVALAMLDVDHFKQVNDVHGHEVGDAVLACLAVLLHDACRPDDVVCRYGGEEFVMLMPGASPDDAIARVETIISDFASTPLDSVRGELRCSFSAGIAVLASGRSTSLSELLRDADAALYAAKAAGRRRVCLARPRDESELPGASASID